MPDLLRHDFTAAEQASFLESLKNTISDGEFIVTLDFSENYSFHIQDAIQSQHWSKDQMTLHVYVIYYKKEGKVKHKNFVVLSEYILHDANCVHLFNERLISHLRQEFGVRNVKKIFYFSHGAGSQYKNKFNFVNLIEHKNDFCIDAEGHFFATSHGKGACDGVGGCVKRSAYRASLRRIYGDEITTPEKFYCWAKKNFQNINFSFCTKEKHAAHQEKLTNRFSVVKTLKNTRKFHCYIPIDGAKLIHNTDIVFRVGIRWAKKFSTFNLFNSILLNQEKKSYFASVKFDARAIVLYIALQGTKHSDCKRV